MVLKEGRLVEEGNHEELMDREGLYYKMWQYQVMGGGGGYYR